MHCSHSIVHRPANLRCAVTRAADVKRDASAPVFVLASNTLTEDWLVGSGSPNPGPELFAQVLGELVYILYAGEIEMETLAPKIVHVVGKTIVWTDGGSSLALFNELL